MQLEKQNHFQKFNLETKFTINEQELENQYLKLQQQFHPDTAKDATLAEIDSILINQAYQILKNPIKRAIYLLQLQNINIEDEECSVKPTMVTLNFVMELREKILENPNQINQIQEKIKKIIADELQEIAELLQHKEFLKAAQTLIRIKYLDKIISDLKKK